MNIFNFFKKSKEQEINELAILISKRSEMIDSLIKNIYKDLYPEKFENLYFQRYLTYLSYHISASTFIYNLTYSGYSENTKEYKQVISVLWELIVLNFHRIYVETGHISGMMLEEQSVKLYGENGYINPIKERITSYLHSLKYLKEKGLDCYSEYEYFEGEHYYEHRNYYFIQDLIKYNFVPTDKGIYLKYDEYSNSSYIEESFLSKINQLTEYLKSVCKP
jgi:hypothetical protein